MITVGTRPDVTLKLSQLQNLCKRDPLGHKSDYDAQIRRLQSECHILSLNPSTKPPAHLSELIQFAAAVSSSSYDKATTDDISNLLVCLLLGKSHEDIGENHFQSLDKLGLPTSALNLHKDVRKSCVSALILMRNKGKLSPLRLLELFYRIMAVIPDKGLRKQLYKHIVKDIRNINIKGKRDEKVNRSIQTFIHKVVASTIYSQSNKNSELDDATKFATKRAVEMVAELYRRKVWTDERTVAILASAVESVIPNVAAAAMRFFLNIEERMAFDQEREENDLWNDVSQIDFHQHSRKTKARARQVSKQIKNKLRAQKRREEMVDTTDCGVEASKKLYPAIELLRNPYGLAEAVLKRIRSTGANGFRFEHKMLGMNFVTRLVGNHALIVLPLYPFLRRYMGGHQKDVTLVLAYAVQACHERVPPEEVHGLLQTIAHNFVTERCSGEQMAVGINSCRAICARVPAALFKEESDGVNDNDGISTCSVHFDVEAFARDLSSYSKHRDRSVAISGRSWQNFIREVYPTLLQGKHRGAIGSALYKSGQMPLRYGEQRAASGVAGADLLIEYETKKEAYSALQSSKLEKSDDDDGDSDGVMYVPMNDAESADYGDGAFPTLFPIIEEFDGKIVPSKKGHLLHLKHESEYKPAVDLSTMTSEDRAKLQQEVSSTRIFSVDDFEKMKKLVEREKRISRDPRAAARLKRLRSQGRDFEELSNDSDSESEENDDIHVKGAVGIKDIAAEAKKRRANKAERLNKIIEGREAFQRKQREGGSTNAEKKRKKNFLMTKNSLTNKMKQNSKQTTRNSLRGHLKKGKRNKQTNHDNKKRRRKM